MKKQGFIVLITAFAVFLASASFSFAAGHSSHKGHSPMDKVGKRPSLHCVLKGHDLSNPCPHIIADDGLAEKSFLSSPCGGKTSNETPFSYNSGSSSFFDLLEAPGYKVHDLNGTFYFHNAQYTSLEPRSFDPPPKLS